MIYLNVHFKPPSIMLHILWIFVLHRSVASLNPLELSHNRLACPSYQFVDYNSTGESVCRDCTYCKRGFEAAKQCTTDSDTECRPCQPGTYNPDKWGVCRPCTVCGPGNFTRRSCTLVRDTVCAPCPGGYFSTGYGVQACKLCKECRTNEVKLELCSKTNNTQCGQCEVGYFREFGSGECLSCSECGDPTDQRVVVECANTVGLGRKNKLCWPLSAKFKAYDDNPDVSTEALLTNDDDSAGKPHIEESNFYADMFLMAFIASMSCVLFIILVGITSKLFKYIIGMNQTSREISNPTMLQQIPLTPASLEENIITSPVSDTDSGFCSEKRLGSQRSNVTQNAFVVDYVTSDSETDISALLGRLSKHQSCDTFSHDNRSFAGDSDTDTSSNDLADSNSYNDTSLSSKSSRSHLRSKKRLLDTSGLATHCDDTSGTDTSQALKDGTNRKKKRRGAGKTFTKPKEEDSYKKKPKQIKKKRLRKGI